MRKIAAVILGFNGALLYSFLADAAPERFKSTAIMFPFFAYLFYNEVYRNKHKDEDAA